MTREQKIEAAIRQISQQGGQVGIGTDAYYWWETGNEEPYSGRDSIDPSADEVIAHFRATAQTARDGSVLDVATDLYREVATAQAEATA